MSDVATSPMPATLSAPDWAGTTGDRWATYVDHFERMLGKIGNALLMHAALAAGENVVEIGCGGGGLTRRVAAAVGPDGTAVGFDISPALVSLATKRAEAAHVTNVAFLSGDAQTSQPLGVPFDRLLSRFGVMFFADPVAAMINLHAMIKPGGRLDFAVWGSIDGNPWASATMEAARSRLTLPPPAPGAPGPFAFADTGYLHSLLEQGGFREISFTPWTGTVQQGGPGVTAEEAAEMAILTGPLAEPLGEVSPDVRAAIKSEIAAFFHAFITDDGMFMPAAVHLVTAVA
jgi:SAM-dependent methyltransferase